MLRPAKEDVRDHPQWSCVETNIPTDSFFGRIRDIYATTVLKTQLEQLKRSGCYDMFTGNWMPCYDTRRSYDGKASPEGLPPSLFWESEIGKWIESVSYFLWQPEFADIPHVKEFAEAVDKLIDEMESFQEPNGYLNVYFTIVDHTGRFRNLRDMHEMYNAGHLLEGALAHYRATGSRKFLDIMIKNVHCFMRTFGSTEDKLPGYPGHPEFELALLRLYAVTGDQRHLQFAEDMLEARGTTDPSLGGLRYFSWEAAQRRDRSFGRWMKRIDDYAYHSAHLPIHEQPVILGHSVRALYLLTACADIGGRLFHDAKRLWTNATSKKMYVTGGIGSEPQSEGFSQMDHYLPFSTDTGGCYAETCASIALMMTSERLLSRELDASYRDVLELCLYNAVLGGGSLDGKGFSYTNVLATSDGETALRPEWDEVCCCPPNLSRTLGMLPGYIWPLESATPEFVAVNIYLYISASRTISLGKDAGVVEISMHSLMPWEGCIDIKVQKPSHTKVAVRFALAPWMLDLSISLPTTSIGPDYIEAIVHDELSIRFDLETRLVYPHPQVQQDTLTVTRGPIVFVAEDFDNPEIEDNYPHFKLLGLREDAQFSICADEIANVPILRLTTTDVFALSEHDVEGYDASLWNAAQPGQQIRTWTRVGRPLHFIPWFARANRGGKGHLRVPFLRVGHNEHIQM